MMNLDTTQLWCRSIEFGSIGELESVVEYTYRMGSTLTLRIAMWVHQNQNTGGVLYDERARGREG